MLGTHRRAVAECGPATRRCTERQPQPTTCRRQLKRYWWLPEAAVVFLGARRWTSKRKEAEMRHFIDISQPGSAVLTAERSREGEPHREQKRGRLPSSISSPSDDKTPTNSLVSRLAFTLYRNSEFGCPCRLDPPHSEFVRFYVFAGSSLTPSLTWMVRFAYLFFYSGVELWLLVGDKPS